MGNSTVVIDVVQGDYVEKTLFTLHSFTVDYSQT